MILQEELWVSINSASFNPSSALCVHAELILLIVFNSDLHNFFWRGGCGSDESNKVEWHCCDLRVCARAHMCGKSAQRALPSGFDVIWQLYVSQDEGYPLVGQPQ